MQFVVCPSESLCVIYSGDTTDVHSGNQQNDNTRACKLGTLVLKEKERLSSFIIAIDMSYELQQVEMENHTQ